jgi:sulfate adenylyltransferase subunit 2
MTVERERNRVLDALESEAIWCIREAASFERPVLLYSIGKDSTVLLRLAQKAFAPAKIPFPVLHIDTGWKFKEMIEFRDSYTQSIGVDLIVHTNTDGRDSGVTPFTHGADEYTRIMKTVALRSALDLGKFTVAIGGARRDEERSRAKERMFSLRGVGHSWEPKNQRPEFWSTVNNLLPTENTMRAFPISNWTELDVWRYVRRENLPIVDLYFAKSRPTIEIAGSLLMVDDDRILKAEQQVPVMKSIRFRTLGCYPLTAAEESTTTDIDGIIQDLEANKVSERAGRLIDGQGSSSMEAKKLEGYF